MSDVEKWRKSLCSSYDWIAGMHIQIYIFHKFKDMQFVYFLLCDLWWNDSVATKTPDRTKSGEREAHAMQTALISLVDHLVSKVPKSDLIFQLPQSSELRLYRAYIVRWNMNKGEWRCRHIKILFWRLWTYIFSMQFKSCYIFSLFQYSCINLALEKHNLAEQTRYCRHI